MNVDRSHLPAFAAPHADDQAPLLEGVGRYSGLVFSVLGIIGFSLAGDAGFDDGVKIAAHFAEHRQRALIGFHVAGASMLLFVLWGWWIMRALDRADGGRSRLGVAVFASAVMVAAVEYGCIALALTLAAVSTTPIDPQLARVLANAYQAFSCADYFPLVAFCFMFGIAVLRTRIVGAWVGWTALALVPLMLVAAAPTLGLDMPVSAPLFLWIIAANVALIRSKQPT